MKTHCRWSQTNRVCDDICAWYRQTQRCHSQTMILKHCLNRTHSRIFILPIGDSILNPKSIDRILHRPRQSFCQLYFHFKSQFSVSSTITHACQWKTLQTLLRFAKRNIYLYEDFFNIPVVYSNHSGCLSVLGKLNLGYNFLKQMR